VHDQQKIDELDEETLYAYTALIVILPDAPSTPVERRELARFSSVITTYRARRTEGLEAVLSVWVPETRFTVVGLLLYTRPEPDMIQRWRYG
jgi:hypothetical protein